MEKVKTTEQKFWKILFLINGLLLLSLIGLVYWLVNSSLILGSKEMLREKVTEKQVYTENSGYIDAVNIVQPALVSIIDKKANVASFSGIILTNDGYVLINNAFNKEKLAEMMAVDYLGERYDLEWLGVKNGFTLTKLWLNGQMILPKEKRDSLFKFKAVLLANLEKQVTGQRLIMVAADEKVGIKLIGETLVSKNNYHSLLPLVQQFDQRLLELEFTDKDMLNGQKAILNLGGELVVLVNTASEYMSATEINGLLAKYDAKTGLGEDMKLGLSCVNLDRNWVFKYQLAADYGCLVGTGLSDQGKVLAGGVAKGSVAEKLGLKDGDLIVEFNNKLLLEGNMLSDYLAKAKGDQLFYRVIRDGKVIELKGEL